ncbi:polysaccharide export outer membrane protein [Variovorax sp. TBS-050B]|jgi:polysaccharide export outer membrane protein|uniref:polysaccharide biosynthesis/export family protein n=1 Tax=Variovorax sp. TBS-050B TaxID=2940551 RepID=UPI002473FB38|nr:polysaccharide biosynthesis/export family protein [Variovorax sp. TBS-050B]MDH6594038.1 polysaccharide export outer membrane protein [Variovorax sp. TBS-050B]
MAHLDPARSPSGARAASATFAAGLRERLRGRRRLAALAALVLPVALALGGCGAPGFGSPTSGSYTVPASDGSGKRVAPKITTITPELVRSRAGQNLQALPEDVQRLFGKAPGYTIAPGDVVGIVVYRHPELMPAAGAVISQQADPTGVSVAPGFIVDAEGEISFPYIGRTKLEGMTERTAAEFITQRIAPYVKDPLVSVRIQTFRGRRVYVEGEVRNPGLQIFTDVPMTLAEAIGRAGSVTTSGDRSRVTLTRGGRTMAIDLAQLQRAGYDASRIPLQNGDIVNVGTREDTRVYVMGEIRNPSPLLMRNGRLSLGEALGDAGGPDLTTSSPGQIYVIRNAGDEVPEVYHLDAKNPVALALADRFELRPRDVVYVDHVPLVNWNRVISLILPSAQIVNLGGTVNRR